MQRENGNPGSTSASSLIDLKAELFRKQEEFKNQKLQSQNTGYIKGKPSATSNKKPNIFSKKNAGVARRSERDYEEKREEEDVFERSKRALESKAQLYEKITSGSEIPEEDGSDVYLVDFQKKVIDDVIERREKDRQEKEDRERREAEEDRRILEEPVPVAENEEDEWVDYVDSLGRSRKCLRKDLPGLQRADKKLQADKGSKKEETPSLLSADMRREIERKKWEEEETETMKKEKEGPIHYADVQHSEIRTHGVGFYQFDKEEAARQEQMERLMKLRDETKDERSKRERIKEKRKAALAARLAKVKQRKREKLGLPDEPEEEGNGSSEEEIGPKLAEQAEPVTGKQEPEPLTRDDSWRQTANLTREWDRGKQKITERSEKTWLEKQRAERETEFAPPSFYYEESKPHPHLSQTKQKPALKRPFQEQETETEDSREAEPIGGDTSAEDRGSQIVADVILKRLREYKGDHETATLDRLAELAAVTAGSSASVSSFTAGYSASVSSFTAGYSASVSSVAAGYSASQSSEQPPSTSYLHTNLQDQFDPTQFPTAGQYPIGPFSVPPPPLNLPQQANQAVTDPGLPVASVLNVPPPNIAVPPPSYGVPSQDFSIPPPTLNVPPPNINIPPPNMAYPPPGYPNQNQEQEQLTQFYQEVQDLQSSTPVSQTAPPPISEPSQPAPSQPKRIIAKADIIDTRLMENEDEF